MKRKLFCLVMVVGLLLLLPTLAHAQIKISSLPETTSPSSSDVLPIVSGGITKKITVANLLGAGPGGTVTATGSPSGGKLAGFSGASSITNVDLTGDVTTSGGLAATIANDVVTYAKMQNISAASKLLGRGDSGAGDPQEITLGPGLSMTGTTLSATGGTVTASSTDTFTNKTIDAEATGNTLTQSFKIWLPAAGCNNTTAASFWDLPTSTPAVAACVTGSNIQKGVLQFADTSGGFSAQNSMLLPVDWTGAIDVKIIWRTSATSGNVKWSFSTISTATDATETDDPSFNTASTVTTAVPGTANRLQTSSITGVTVTGVALSEFLHFKIFRDGNDGSDTAGASVDLIGVEITIRRAQ